MGPDNAARHPYRSKQTKTRVTDSTLQIQLAEEDDPHFDNTQGSNSVKLPNDAALARSIDKLKKLSKKNS